MSGTIFWAAAAVISIAVTLIVATPLLRAGQRIGGAARARYDLAVFRDQLKEVERDQETGLLSPTEAIAAKGEIERRMLRAVDGDVDALDAPDEEATPQASAAAFPLALGIVVAGAVIALYLNTGQPGMGDAPLSLRTDLQTAARGPAQAGGGADGAAMQAQLRQRLADNPNDMAGWVTLARTERVLGNHPEAVRAFERAIELAGRNATADLIADYGEAQVFEAFGTVSPRAIETFENALEKDPGEIKSRFYIAEGRAQSGDYAGAIALWRGLTADAPPDAPWVGEVRARIANAAMKGNIMPMQVQPERPSGNARPASGLSGAIAGEAAPTADDVQAVQEMAPQDQTAFIRSMVQRLADKMEENPDDVDGWLRLGRAYQVLEDQEKSKAAFGQAKRRLEEILANIPETSPNRASLLETLAEVDGILAQ
ncbi:MAG: c-type cytochrome biogenesis protein CcmI [Alphaproteobacteria bacterium]|jgi:cytochrome c-type biogenesis protein CcmH|nr:c-type cytochrome biogenesis protein CcmI [Alphaproteobacteria bacterium]